MHVNFNVWSMSLSGGVSTVLNLANGLVERGHEVSVTALDRGGRSEWFGSIQAQVNYVETSLKHKVLRKFFNAPWEYDYCKSLAEAIPDCDVNVATLFETVYPTLFSGNGFPVYLVQHYEPWFYRKGTTSFHRAKVTYSLPLKKVAVSRWLCKLLDATYVGNGVDLDVFKPSKTPKSYEPPYNVMGFLRGIEWKGDRIFVKMLRLLQQHHEIQAISPYSHNPSPLNEVLAMYATSHCFVFPSMFEGFGLPPLEAMACGVPCVVSDCAGVNEYAKHGVNCLVPRSWDFRDFAVEVLKVLLNPKLREKIVLGGFETAKKYDFKKVVERFEKAVKEVGET